MHPYLSLLCLQRTTTLHLGEPQTWNCICRGRYSSTLPSKANPSEKKTFRKHASPDASKTTTTLHTAVTTSASILAPRYPQHASRHTSTLVETTCPQPQTSSSFSSSCSSSSELALYGGKARKSSRSSPAACSVGDRPSENAGGRPRVRKRPFKQVSRTFSSLHPTPPSPGRGNESVCPMSASLRQRGNKVAQNKKVVTETTRNKYLRGIHLRGRSYSRVLADATTDLDVPMLRNLH